MFDCWACNRFAMAAAMILFAATGHSAVFEIIAMPDTENYVDVPSGYPGIMAAQTQWIVDNRAIENIVFTTHLGDLIHHDPAWEMPEVISSMAILDRQVPYSVCAGNHELESTTAKEMTKQNFGSARYYGYNWYGGSYNNFNHYQILSVADYEFLHINLQKDPDDGTLQWAQQIISQNLGKPTIVSTHDYQYTDTSRSATGDDIWNKLIKSNPQIFMVLSGHYHTPVGSAHMVSNNLAGKPVLQMLSDFENYTTQPNTFNTGYLRKIIFDPDNRKISIKTYSPTYATVPWLTDNAHQFSYDVAFLPQVPGTTLSPIVVTDAATCPPAGYSQDFEAVPGPTGTALPLGWTVWQIGGTGATFFNARPIQAVDVAAAVSANQSLLVASTSPTGSWDSQASNAQNDSGRALATNPGSNGAGVLQLKVINAMGAPVTNARLSYNLARPWSNANDDGAELPGYTLFWSTTGSTVPADWTRLGEDAAAGSKVWDITLPASLTPGADLYLRWADDNVTGLGGEAAAENVWSIDNVRVTMNALPSTLNWSGRVGGDDRWSIASNWSGQTPLADKHLSFGVPASGGHATNNNDLPVGTRFGSITFAANAPGYRLQGNAIQLAGPIQNLSGNDQEISLDIELTSGCGEIDDGGRTLTMSGSFRGAGPITKTGSGRLILSGTNTYVGATTIADGFVEIDLADGLAPGDLVITGCGDLILGAQSTSAASARVSRRLAVNVAPVPEPGTLGLLAIGLAVAGIAVAIARATGS